MVSEGHEMEGRVFRVSWLDMLSGHLTVCFNCLEEDRNEWYGSMASYSVRAAIILMLVAGCGR